MSQKCRIDESDSSLVSSGSRYFPDEVPSRWLVAVGNCCWQWKGTTQNDKPSKFDQKIIGPLSRIYDIKAKLIFFMGKMIQKQSPYHHTSPYRHFQTTQTAACRIHRCSKSHSDAAVFRGRFHLRKRELFRWTWLWFCDLLVSCLVFWRSCSVSFRFAFLGHLNIWWKTMKAPLIPSFPKSRTFAALAMRNDQCWCVGQHGKKQKQYHWYSKCYSKCIWYNETGMDIITWYNCIVNQNYTQLHSVTWSIVEDQEMLVTIIIIVDQLTPIIITSYYSLSSWPIFEKKMSKTCQDQNQQ